MTRDPSLIKAELVDAMQDYVHIFKEKAAMEMERFEDFKVGDVVQLGEHPSVPKIYANRAFWKIVKIGPYIELSRPFKDKECTVHFTPENYEISSKSRHR